jgi:hypothetical protein
MRLTTTDINRALLAVGVIIVTFVAASPLLKDKEDGLLGVFSAVSWFGLFLLVPAFVVLLLVVATRRLRRHGRRPA